MNESGEFHPETLHGEDAWALDALVEAGFDVAGVPEDLRERAQRVAGLLGLVDSPVTEFGGGERVDGGLIDAAEARVRGSEGALVEDEVALCALDDEALETAVMAGFEASRVTSGLRDRARVHGDLRSLVTASSPSTEAWIEAGSVSRIDSVMGEIERAGDAPIPLESGGRGVRFRWADLGAIAAVLVLFVSVAFPVIGSTRQSAMQAACLGHLGSVGRAMGTYANDFGDALPMAAPSMNGSWMRVGSSPDQSNSANLYVIVRARYAALEDLACPGNEHGVGEAVPERMEAADWRSLDEVSYSYQLMWGAAPRVWETSGDRVVLTDRSPVVLAAAQGRPVSPEADSPNHGGVVSGSGQHLLRMDGSAPWTTSPVLENGDNIWLPRSIERAIEVARQRAGLVQGVGSALPESVEDVFVGP